MAATLTAKELTGQRIPDCCFKVGFHTTSSAVHKDKGYTGNLAVWEEFEKEVRQTFQDANFGGHHLEHDKAGLDEAINLRNEYYRCGEETSVSGRFVQHALHVMSVVAKTSKFSLTFGDWKASRTSRGVEPMNEINVNDQPNIDEETKTRNNGVIKEALSSQVPDYCIIDGNDDARAVGEAKVPWNHPFNRWWSSYETGDDETMKVLLGQIAYYMQNAGLKYGFITNYESTFFLKQEKMGNTSSLQCSPPIAHNKDASEKGVSVRQCLFYLLVKTEEKDAWRFVNPSKTWVVKRESKEKKAAFDKRIEDATAMELALGGKPQTGEPQTGESGTGESEDAKLVGGIQNMKV